MICRETAMYPKNIQFMKDRQDRGKRNETRLIEYLNLVDLISHGNRCN
jgi:hypothetical protein